MTENNSFDFIDEVAQVRSGSCYCFALRKASRRLMRLYDQRLSPHGLTIGQFALLCMIAGDDTYTVQELADILDMNQSALSRGLAPLEARGLLASTTNPDDGRKRMLTLTEVGAEHLNRAAKSWKAAQLELADQNENLDMAQFMTTLARLSATQDE